MLLDPLQAEAAPAIVASAPVLLSAAVSCVCRACESEPPGGLDQRTWIPYTEVGRAQKMTPIQNPTVDGVNPASPYTCIYIYTYYYQIPYGVGIERLYNVLQDFDEDFYYQEYVRPSWPYFPYS